MKYELSVKANSDLSDIWEHTFENWSKEQADAYIKLLFDAINHLCDQPGKGRNYGYVRDGYRGLRVKSHIIFYRIGNSEALEIIRILHQKMDIDARLKNS